MDRSTHDATVRLRAAALWLAVTAVLTGVGLLAVPPAHALATSPAADFTGLLVQLCSVAALAAGGWLWLVTSGVVVDAARGAACAPDRAARVPGAVRRTLLAACGVAALTATPAAADDTGTGRRTGPTLPAGALHGLALPDRPAGAPADAAPAGPSATTPVVRVRAGDSLWSIAARHLGPTAGVPEVAAYWRRIHRLNADLIGPDPDLVVPGQQLRLPPGDHPPRRSNP
ncbi:LysM peptidoglycan-binding domain-containing protein [Nocardioides sp. SYSU DS0651]|uniref:LysM peptidoglycan-binding domain-containing protein n=1 Tax=Nocardioides sp. SYSU DS0651 TaxID=3415955 RepID=UPI003F4B2392